MLSTPLATQTAGGRITVYAGSSRYVLPFENATVAGAGEGQRARPVFYRFAAPTPVESAYVSWLDGSDSGPCDPFEPWEAALHPSPRLASDPDASVLAKPAPPPEPAEPLSCAAPSVPSGVTTYATVYRPPVAAPKGSAVTVKVILDTRGAVVSATVQNSDDPGLDATAIDAAQRTIFSSAYLSLPAGRAVPICSSSNSDGAHAVHRSLAKTRFSLPLRRRAMFSRCASTMTSAAAMPYANAGRAAKRHSASATRMLAASDPTDA